MSYIYMMLFGLYNGIKLTHDILFLLSVFNRAAI